jgi:GDP-L-fucose synthase
MPVNIGAGADIAIADLARLVMEVVDYPGGLVTDPTKPDGTPRKLLDCARLTALGWQPTIGLREGIAQTYQAFLAGNGRGV